MLLRKANVASSDSASLDQLASLIIVDRRSKLPHLLWKPSHDAVLISAIVKHGWIEQESSCRAIADDTSLKWGVPFEASNGPFDLVPDGPRETDADVLATANRVASFLNESKELLDDIKGLNVDELARVYGLTRRRVEGSTDVGTGSLGTWIVDDAAALAAGAVPTTNSNAAQDLPPQRDLVARAKTLLTFHHPQQVSAASQVNQAVKDGVKPTYPYAVLDQSVRCNTFLAELLRGLLKVPPQKFGAKKKSLCTLARIEAVKRVESFKAAVREQPAHNSELARAAADMEKIVTHLDVVKRELGSHKARLYKNVLRVILGLDPTPSKTEEALFPTEKPVSDKMVLQTYAGSDNRTSSTNSKTTGERAFDAASRKLYVVKRGQENNADNSLDLTEVETLILRVACAVGLPVWRKDWKTQTRRDKAADKASICCNVSWAEFGRLLVEFADASLSQEETKRQRVQQASGSIKGNSEEVLYNAQRQYNLKQSACTQAAEYANDPETLAKKTIMMFPRLQRFARDAGSKNDAVLHPKVMKWLEADVRLWSTSLDLVDTAGSPLGFTAKDFLEDLNEEDRAVIEIAACFDRQGCNNVLQQVALMSRARSIFLSRNSIVKDLVKKASSSLSSQKWDLEPNWWRADGTGRRQDADHDILLLERLVRGTGFSTILSDTKDFGLSKIVSCSMAVTCGTTICRWKTRS